MKGIKRLLSMLLIIAIIAGILPNPAYAKGAGGDRLQQLDILRKLYTLAYEVAKEQENGTRTFNDLNDVEWAREPIEKMAAKGIINGTGAETFSPKANITRADYLVLLIRALGLSAAFDSNFDDVEPGTYYYQPIGIAKKLGIATGSGNNRFNPKESISRQDMMVLTLRALEKLFVINSTEGTSVLDKFNDKNDIADYALKSIASLVREGLIQGSGESISPRAYTTRAQAAVFLYRIYSRFAESRLVYDRPGSYGPEEGILAVNQDVVIKSPDVRLRNMNIKGNLTIAEEVGRGTVYLDNIVVDGETYVRGGGKDSIYINGGKYKNIVVQKVDGKVRIVATDVNNLPVVISDDAAGEEIILEGEFESVTIEAENVTVTTQGETVIKEIVVKEGGDNSVLAISETSVVENMVLEAKADVKGTGTIKQAEIRTEGINFERPPENVILSEPNNNNNNSNNNNSGDDSRISYIARFKQLVKSFADFPDAVKTIKKEYSISALEMAKLLKQEDATVHHAAYLLCAAGYQFVDVTAALNEAYSDYALLDWDPIILLEQLIGMIEYLSLHQIFEVVDDGSVTFDEICRIGVELYYYAIEFYKSGGNFDWENHDIYRLLSEAGYTVEEIEAFLIEAYDKLNISVNNLLEVIYSYLSENGITLDELSMEDVEALIELLVAYGEELPGIISILLEELKLNSELVLSAIVEKLDEIIPKLKNITAREVLNIIAENFDLDQIVEVLDKIASVRAFTPMEIFDSLLDAFGLESIASDMYGIVEKCTGFKLKDALDSIFDKYTIEEMIQYVHYFVMDIQGYTPSDIAGYFIEKLSAEEIAEYMDDILEKLAGADNLQAFKDLLGKYTIDQIVEKLGVLAEELKLEGTVILTALMDVYLIENIIAYAQEIADELLDVSPQDVLTAIVRYFGPEAVAARLGDILDELKDLSARDVLEAILEGVDSLNAIIDELDDIIEALVDLTPAQIFVILVQKLDLEEVVAHLERIVREHGLDLAEVLRPMLDKYTIAGIIRYLEDIVMDIQGYTPADIISYFISELSAGEFAEYIDDILKKLAGTENLQTFKDLLDKHTLGEIAGMLRILAEELKLWGTDILTALLEEYPIEDIINYAQVIAEELLDVTPADVLAAILAYVETIKAEITIERLSALVRNFDLKDIAARLLEIHNNLAGELGVDEMMDTIIGYFGLADIIKSLKEINDFLNSIFFDIEDFIIAILEKATNLNEIIDYLDDLVSELGIGDPITIFFKLVERFGLGGVLDNYDAILGRLGLTDLQVFKGFIDRCTSLDQIIGMLGQLMEKLELELSEILTALRIKYSIEEIIGKAQAILDELKCSSSQLLAAIIAQVEITQGVLNAILDNFNLEDIVDKLVDIINKLSSNITESDVLKAILEKFNNLNTIITELEGIIAALKELTPVVIFRELLNTFGLNNVAAKFGSIIEKLTGLTLEDVLNALRVEYGIGEIIEYLHNLVLANVAGFSPSDIFEYFTNNLSPEEIAEYMDDILQELTGLENLQAFLDMLNTYTLEQIIAILGNLMDQLNLTLSQVLDALRSKYGFEAIIGILGEIAANLELTGLQILTALMEVCPVGDIIANAREIAEELFDSNLARILETIVEQMEITQELLTALLQEFSLSDIIEILKNAGKSIGEIIDILLGSLDAGSVLSAIIDSFDANAISGAIGDIIGKLKSAGIGTLIDQLLRKLSHGDVLNYIVTCLNGTEIAGAVGDIISKLKPAGTGTLIDKLLVKLSALDVLNGFLAHLSLTELKALCKDIVSKLKTLGISTIMDRLLTKLDAAAVLDAITSVFTTEEISSKLDMIVEMLKDAGVNELIDKLCNAANIAEATVAAILKGHGFSLKDIAKAFKEIEGYAIDVIYNNILKNLINNAVELADVLAYAGYTANQVGALLKNVLSETGFSISRALAIAGFDAEQVAAALNSLFSLDPSILINYLDFGFERNIEEVVKGLVHIYNKYSDPYFLTDLLKSTNWFTAVDIAKALKYGLDEADSMIVNCLAWIGYTPANIATAMKEAFQYGEQNVAQLLKEVWNDAKVIAEALKSAYNLGESALRSILGAVGFLPSAIEDAINWLKSIFPFL